MSKVKQDFFKYLGSEIRKRRKIRDWSQEKLAEVSGVAFNHVSRIERGVTNPRLATLKLITDALGTSLSDIFSFTLTPDKKPSSEILLSELKKSLKDNPKLQAKIISELANELKTKI